MPLPNLIIAGPPKSGTTSLFEWLSRHPDAHPSIIKETDYFNQNIPTNSSLKHFGKNGWEGYEDLFSGWMNQKVIFEASPKYIYSSLAIKELSNIPEVKVLFIKRNESERLYSEFKFHRYKTKLFAGSFSDYLIHKNIDLQKGIKDENTFGYWISLWMQNFEAFQLKIIDFESLKSNPSGTFRNVCDFLEIDKKIFDDFSFKTFNKTHGIRSKRLHYFLLKFHKYFPNKLRSILTSFYYSVNRTGVPPQSHKEEKLIEDLENSLKSIEEKYEKSYAQLFLK